jgi:hypothetical protein
VGWVNQVMSYDGVRSTDAISITAAGIALALSEVCSNENCVLDIPIESVCSDRWCWIFLLRASVQLDYSHGERVTGRTVLDIPVKSM